MAEYSHAPYDKLSRATVTLHQAIQSLVEELEAADWYRQRCDDCADDGLKAILRHNMREEYEHAAMLLEWLRRTDADFAERLSAYLFTTGPIAERDKETLTVGAGGPGWTP